MTAPLAQGLGALVDLAVRVGQDPLHVQGGGGNLSLKEGDDLWVKASGAWLARARTEDTFLRVPLALARAHATSPSFAAALAPHHDATLRPSLETPMHALMPHAVVLHVHSVNAIAWATRQEPHAPLWGRLSGLRWAWVPYERPGAPLASAIERALVARDEPVEVLVLGNHGLVLGAASCDAAYELMTDVDARLHLAPRPVPAGDEAHLAAVNDLGWHTPSEARLHGLATDRITLDIVTRGALYPDHAVFLGERAVIVPPGSALSAAVADAERAGEHVSYALVPGAGTLLSPTLSAGALAMLGCALDVGLRVDAVRELAFLPSSEVDALSRWESEAYRRARGPSVEGPCR